MNMLVFDPIGTMSHDFLRVSQYFAIPPKLYKKSEVVVRLESERSRVKQEKSNIRIRNWINHKLEEEELLQGSYYSYITFTVLKL